MARIRGRDTGPEKAVESALRAVGLVPEVQARDLPGRPDFVFRDQRVAVFIDGDFWHGWQFSQWRDKLSEKWEAKIAATRARDSRNHRKLRRLGWKVVRIWEHSVESGLDRCTGRILKALEADGSGIYATGFARSNEEPE